jgi:hypothetical protein
MLLFQPRAIEIHGVTDEGVARSFAEFLGETVATSPLGRGEAYASGFVILIILIHIKILVFSLNFQRRRKQTSESALQRLGFLGVSDCQPPILAHGRHKGNNFAIRRQSAKSLVTPCFFLARRCRAMWSAMAIRHGFILLKK